MKQTKSYNSLLRILFTVLVVMILAATVQAVGASPLRVEYSGMPGEVVKGQLTVLNTSEETKNILITKSDFKVDKETEDVIFIRENAENYAHSLQEWIHLSANEIAVKGNNKKVISYEIHIPEDAESKGYYGSLFVQSAPNLEEKSDAVVGARLNVRVAHLILLEVEGDLIHDVLLKDMTANDLGDGNIQFKIVMFNNGNVHNAPKGTVEIFDLKGNIIHESEVNKGEHNVMPLNKKTFEVLCPKEKLPEGNYYVIFRGETEDSEKLEAEVEIEITKEGEINIIKSNMEYINSHTLRAAAQERNIVFQTSIAVLAILILAISFMGIGRYCVLYTIETKTTRKRKKKK